jgi:hypothetical protein
MSLTWADFCTRVRAHVVAGKSVAVRLDGRDATRWWRCLAREFFFRPIEIPFANRTASADCSVVFAPSMRTPTDTAADVDMGRVCIDASSVPPVTPASVTVDEVEAFLSDAHDKAAAHVVERSPASHRSFNPITGDSSFTRLVSTIVRPPVFRAVFDGTRVDPSVFLKIASMLDAAAVDRVVLEPHRCYVEISAPYWVPLVEAKLGTPCKPNACMMELEFQ